MILSLFYFLSVMKLLMSGDFITLTETRVQSSCARNPSISILLLFILHLTLPQKLLLIRQLRQPETRSQIRHGLQLFRYAQPPHPPQVIPPIPLVIGAIHLHDSLIQIYHIHPLAKQRVLHKLQILDDRHRLLRLRHDLQDLRGQVPRERRIVSRQPVLAPDIVAVAFDRPLEKAVPGSRRTTYWPRRTRRRAPRRWACRACRCRWML